MCHGGLPTTTMTGCCARRGAAHAAKFCIVLNTTGVSGSCAGRELVQQVAANGCVIVTWANHHYLDFVLNWVHHLQLLGVTSYLVGAMDDALLQVCNGWMLDL